MPTEALNVLPNGLGVIPALGSLSAPFGDERSSGVWLFRDCGAPGLVAGCGRGSGLAVGLSGAVDRQVISATSGGSRRATTQPSRLPCQGT
jgi:hypothetical protein